MKEKTLENIHKNPKYISILLPLIRYRKGLTLHELMFLLSKVNLVKHKMKLTDRFGRETKRKNIFKKRQRLCDYLKRLRRIGLIYKDNRKYKIELSALLYWCDIRDAAITYQKRIKKAKEKYKKSSKYIKNLDSERKEALDEDFVKRIIRGNFPELWEEFKKYSDFLTEYPY